MSQPTNLAVPVEQGLRFPCQGDSLVGVLSMPAVASGNVGVVIAVGGPQYRAGSHRQFVLMARALAAAGFPVLRFDARGMGDSTGEFPGFEHLGPDLQAAAQALQGAAPAVRRVVLWGLCDAASAAMMNATRVPQLAGMVLLNPWVRHADTHARTEVKKYYAQRLLDRAFWRKLLAGQVQVGTGLRELSAKLWRMGLSYLRPAVRGSSVGEGAGADAGHDHADYRERMAQGALRCGVPQLYILSGRDHVCAEFLEYAGGHAGLRELWQRPAVQRLDHASADHTFSNAELRAAVERATLDWLRALPP